jgi:hypothetical protein
MFACGPKPKRWKSTTALIRRSDRVKNFNGLRFANNPCEMSANARWFHLIW